MYIIKSGNIIHDNNLRRALCKSSNGRHLVRSDHTGCFPAWHMPSALRFTSSVCICLLCYVPSKTRHLPLSDIAEDSMLSDFDISLWKSNFNSYSFIWNISLMIDVGIELHLFYSFSCRHLNKSNFANSQILRSLIVIILRIKQETSDANICLKIGLDQNKSKLIWNFLWRSTRCEVQSEKLPLEDFHYCYLSQL